MRLEIITPVDKFQTTLVKENEEIIFTIKTWIWLLPKTTIKQKGKIVSTIKPQINIFRNKRTITIFSEKERPSIWYFQTASFIKNLSHGSYTINNNKIDIYWHKNWCYSVYKNNEQIARRKPITWYVVDGGWNVTTERNEALYVTIAVIIMWNRYHSTSWNIHKNLWVYWTPVRKFDDAWKPKDEDTHIQEK